MSICWNGQVQTCPIGARSVAGVMSNGAPSADAKSGDGRASRDSGRDRAMSRGGMSCDGATSVGKASNGRTMTGGMTSGAATTIGAEASASATGTIGATIGAMTDAARGSLRTAVAGRDRRCTERKDATHECAVIAASLAVALTVIRSTLGS